MLDFYKSLLKSRVLALMHGSKQLQYTASVVRTSGNISLCILIRILKLQLLKGFIFCENPLLFICISTRTSTTSTYHTFNNFSLKRNKDLNPNHYSSLAFTLGLYTFLYAKFFTFLKHHVYLPYWWCVTTQFLVALPIGWSKFPTQLDQSEALYWSG